MAMRNKTIEEGVITTPMRKLIKKLPGKIMKLNIYQVTPLCCYLWYYY